MLKKGDLSTAFKVYWDDAKRCLEAKAYWCLLHVTACLPDVCAALQSRNGKTDSEKYKKWSDKYFKHDALTKLTGHERYVIRCIVLHQGRARAAKEVRYRGFAFGQPDACGRPDHLRIDGRTLHVDVAELSRETREAMRAWIVELESNPTSAKASYAAKNLRLLVHVSNQSVPLATCGPKPVVTVINKTN
jgi:hypothetical protein